MIWFFKGMKQERFAALGNHFSKKAKELKRMDTMEYLLKHKADGDTISIITASVEEWVKPICESIGVSQVLATKMEVVSKPLKPVDYDIGKYDWDKIARQVNDVYKGMTDY